MKSIAIYNNKGGVGKSELVPVFIDSAQRSDAEHKLNLIMLNATSRVMSDAEKLQQYRELKSTFEQFALEGNKIPGRMRDKIASAMNLSATSVARIEKVEKSSDKIKNAVDNGEISISVAAKIAELPEEKHKEEIASIISNSSQESRKEKQRQNNKSQKGMLYRPEEPPLTMSQRTITLSGEDVAEIVMGLVHL